MTRDQHTLNLFSRPAPYSDGDTSKAAAKEIAPVVGKLRRSVLAKVVEAGSGGLTCDEVEQLLVLSHQTASARLNELAGASVIVDSGTRRLTRSRRKAIVWVAVPAAKMMMGLG
jgi:hypothetical protein